MQSLLFWMLAIQPAIERGEEEREYVLRVTLIAENPTPQSTIWHSALRVQKEAGGWGSMNCCSSAANLLCSQESHLRAWPFPEAVRKSKKIWRLLPFVHRAEERIPSEEGNC